MTQFSLDGKGRTVWQMLTGQNKKDMTPLELKYHNPLKAVVGSTRISFEDKPDLVDSKLDRPIAFAVEGIRVYDTRFGNRHFYHTDYVLRGVQSGNTTPIRLILRIVEGKDTLNKMGELQMLRIMDEFGEDREPEFEAAVLRADTGIFQVDKGHDGQPLEIPVQYWRVDDVRDPYEVTCTTLEDTDGNGRLDDNELETDQAIYWDYHRGMVGQNGEDLGKEYLWVEKRNHFFTILVGSEVDPTTVSVL